MKLSIKYIRPGITSVDQLHPSTKRTFGNDTQPIMNIVMMPSQNVWHLLQVIGRKLNGFLTVPPVIHPLIIEVISLKKPNMSVIMTQIKAMQITLM